MREPEGLEMPPPGKSSERPWSKHREPDIRNAEAEGSNPFTSTKAQFRGLKWDPPEGHESRLSATGFVVEVEDASWPHSPKNQVSGISVTVGGCDWARVSLCAFIDKVWFFRNR